MFSIFSESLLLMFTTCTADKKIDVEWCWSCGLCCTSSWLFTDHTKSWWRLGRYLAGVGSISHVEHEGVFCDASFAAEPSLFFCN